MLLSEKVKVNLHNSNYNHYISLGYFDKYRESIEVLVVHLQNSSEVKVKVKCDICDSEKELIYNKYLKNIKKWNIYCCCSKCSQIKRKKTNKLIYNDENYNNLEKSKEYHYNKFNLCRNKNVDLISIYEHDWNNEEYIIKEKLVNLLNNNILYFEKLYNKKEFKIDRNWKLDKLLNNKYELINENNEELITDYKKYNVYNTDCFNFKKRVNKINI